MAATPLIGEPLAMNAIAGPEPSRMSIESLAAACCMRASPAKAVSSSSTLLFWKMPLRMPTSGGTNENASGTALPTRNLSAAAAGMVIAAVANAARASTKRENESINASCVISRASGNPLSQRRRAWPLGPHLCGDEWDLRTCNIGVPPAPALGRPPRPYPVSPLMCRGLVGRQIVPEHNPIVLERGLPRHELFQYITADQRRIALDRIAPAAAAAGAHDRFRHDRNRNVRTHHRLEVVLAGQPQ